MLMGIKESKRKYYDKLYLKAPLAPCKCGCGTMTKTMDKWGRKKEYVHGHNRRKQIV